MSLRRPESIHVKREKKIKVLALVTDAFGGFGGIAQYNRNFLQALASARHVAEIEVLPRQGKAAEGQLPDKVHQLPPMSSKGAYVWRALRRALCAKRPDVIFCGHLFMAPLAATLKRLTDARLWLQLHGIEAWWPPSPWVRRAAEQADLITAVSRYTRRRFLAWAAVAPHKVRVLPNTVQERFRPGPKPAQLAQRLDVTGRKVLLSVGRLAASERYKGHDRVIRALPEVLRAEPEVIYLIAGDGDDAPRLQALAREMGVADKVVFAGRVRDDELPDIYRLADVFVMPSTGEGFGIVFLEAAASGVPVIAAQGDGSADALADGRLGRLVAPDDLQELAAAIIAALRQPQRPDPQVVARFALPHFAKQVRALTACI